MKRIIFVSHCILNTASKVEQDEAGLEDEYRERRNLMGLALEKDIQIVQLPCPEFQIYGSRRWGHVKDQFDNPFYKERCNEMLEPFFLEMEEYCSRPDRFQILGVVSVEGSPSCGHGLTCRGDWRGEVETESRFREIRDDLRMTEEPGVFMEILEEGLTARALKVPVLSLEGMCKVISSL